MAVEFYLGLRQGGLYGQKALAVVEKNVNGADDSASYEVRILERLDAEAPVERLVERAQELMTTAPYTGQLIPVVDISGESAKIAEGLQAAGMSPITVAVTSGDGSGEASNAKQMSKRNLLKGLRGLDRKGQLRLPPEQEEASEIADALAMFSAPEDGETDQGVGSERDKDDSLALAVALACWYGERRKEAHPLTPGNIPGPRPRP